MAEYGFTENIDWKRVYPKCPTLGGDQNMVDYEISVDVLRHIYLIGGTGAVRRSQNWIGLKK